MDNYSIDDGHGNQITTGLQAHVARATAQEIANERGESVYLYVDGSEDDSEEIEPSSTKRTVRVAPSVGTSSMEVDTAGAMDYDVTLTIGATSIECEVTLIPSKYDGSLDSWGDLDHWLSSAGVQALEALSDDARRTVAGEIVAACVSGEVSEIDIEAQ